MDGFEECKLCDNNISDGNFKMIDDDIKNVFEVLLLNMILDNETPNVICVMCYSKLLSALNFKSTCLDTDDALFPYIDFENPKPFDLKEIYAKSKQETSMLDDREVCRLCFQRNSDHKSIQEVPVEDIQIFIPEIDFTVTTNPVICTKCHDALRVHSSVIKNCLGVERKRNTVTIDVQDIPLTDSSVKTEEIEIKYERIEEGMFTETSWDIKEQQHGEGDTPSRSQDDSVDVEESKSMLCDPDDLKPTSARSPPANRESEQRLTGRETQATEGDGDNRKTKRQHSRENQVKPVTEGLNVKEYRCDKCQFNTRHKYVLTKHQAVHKAPFETQMYACDECKFITEHRGNLKRHRLKHRDPSEVRMYVCDECDYKTLQKVHLKAHRLRHKHPSEVQMFECDECDYKSLRKGNLKNHKLRHIDPSEMKMYACNECQYVTKLKPSLVRHQLCHKDPCDVKMYVCDVCDYRNRHKANLKTHKLKHKDPCDVRMYQCDECDYKSLRKDHLRNHQLTHADPSKVQMYECDECDFKSLHKSNLKTHQSKHKDPCDVQMYECDECDYKSLRKCHLKSHMLRHKNPSETQMYQCDQCHFITKLRGNLKRHRLTHRDPSEVRMYQCDVCDYKSLRKDGLRAHQLRHRDPSRV